MLSNRDEFLERPAAALDFWPDQPILAGRDLRSGGAWLGFGAHGRWAVLTNLPGVPPPAPPTRGRLVQDFLMGGLSPQEYALGVQRQDFAGFNLLVGAPGQLVYVSTQSPPRVLGPGLQVLGNTPIEQSSERTDRALQLVEQSGTESVEEQLDLFRDPLVWIDLGLYGTRCTTLARVTGGDLTVWERTRGQATAVRRDWPGWLQKE
ncbi:hypothetical protein ABS71_14405 [bacterium SCN 62-11]|nr:MAG: hypothetical protein ABS71_14405 [bacterium SCN 62-11]